MERIAHKSKSFKEAERWDIAQQVAMTPQERFEAAAELKRRAYPTPHKDIRECLKIK